MKVELIAITQPALWNKQADRLMTAEELIAYAARVSNPNNQDNHDTAGKLLAYCIKHGHWSVFETASMTLEIVTSRAIAAQLLRHRSFTFQEFSQRYAKSSDLEPIELRKQDLKNRQGSGEVINDPELMEEVEAATIKSFATYHLLLSQGVSKETARMVLPMATQTTLYMTGNIRSWIHYFKQRTYAGTQKEHREIALAALGIFTQEFPSIAELIKS